MKRAEIVVLADVRVAELPPDDPAERARLLSLWLDLGMAMNMEELRRSCQRMVSAATSDPAELAFAFRRAATYR